MKKKVLSLVLALVMMALLVMLSGCGKSEPEPTETLSGTYVSVEDASKYMEFSDKKVTLYEGDKQIRSGDYRFLNGALIVSYKEFSERYILDENRETLYQGNSNKADYGEVSFTKGANASGNNATNTSDAPEPTKAMGEARSTPLTEDKALEIAGQFLDTHPLYKRTLTGEIEYESANQEYDTTGLYRIGIIADDGSARSMWVSKATGEVFISPDGAILLTGEEYYDTVCLNPIPAIRKFINPDPSIPEVIYNGSPVTQLFGLGEDEIIELFGEPDETTWLSDEPSREVSYGRDFKPIYKRPEGIKEIIVDHAMDNKPFDVNEIISKIFLYKYNNSGIIVLFSNDTKTVISVMLPPGKCELNEETLDQPWYDLGTLFTQTKGYKTNKRSMTEARDYLVYDSPDTIDVCVAVDVQMNALSVTVTWIDAIPKAAGAPKLPRVEYIKNSAQSDLYGTWSWTENTGSGTMSSEFTLYSDGTFSGQYVFSKNGEYASYGGAIAWSFLDYEQILVLYNEEQYYDTTFGKWLPKMVERRLKVIINGQQLSLEALDSPGTRDVVYTKIN